MAKRKILPTLASLKRNRMEEQPKKKEEIIRKSLDLPKSSVDALTIQAVKKGFKNFKKYCESILKDVSKQK
jgi:hypothetical protein